MRTSSSTLFFVLLAGCSSGSMAALEAIGVLAGTSALKGICQSLNCLAAAEKEQKNKISVAEQL